MQNSNLLTSGDMLKAVRRIEIKTSHIVNDYFAGAYQSIFKGRGIEFDEVRRYVIGDDVRTMDWKVSARYNEPFIKRFREERELSVMILADFSASTNFGFTKTKRNLIAELSALFAFSAIKNNDKVGLMIFTDKVEKFLPLRKGRNHILRIIRELIEYTPKSLKTDISKTLEYFNKIQKRKSVVFLLTDFCNIMQAKELDITRKRHDLIVGLVNDNLEYELPNTKGTIVLSDSENEELLYLDLSNKNIRESYNKEQKKINKERISFLKKHSIDNMIFDTSKDYLPEIVKFFKSRKRVR